MRFLERLFRRNPARAAARKPELSSAPERLAEAVSALHQLEIERLARADPCYGKDEEERIIWRELIDLEMQELYEQSGRH